jgi:hypothetical protein
MKFVLWIQYTHYSECKTDQSPWKFSSRPRLLPLLLMFCYIGNSALHDLASNGTFGFQPNPSPLSFKIKAQ